MNRYPVNDRQLAIALLALGHTPDKTDGSGFMTMYFEESAEKDAQRIMSGEDVTATIRQWIYADNQWNMHLNQWRIREKSL